MIDTPGGFYVIEFWITLIGKMISCTFPNMGVWNRKLILLLCMVHVLLEVWILDKVYRK